MKATQNRYRSRAAIGRLREAMREAQAEVRADSFCHGFGVERETTACDTVRRLLEKECGTHSEVY